MTGLCFRLPGLLLVSLLTPPCFAQAPQGPSGSGGTGFTISGEVRFAESNQPADGIRIELRRFTGEVIALRFTRANGDFEFPRLARGSYHVVVEQTGFEPVSQALEISGTDYRGLILYLARPRSLSGGAPGHTVSVKQLSISRKARDAFKKGMDLRYQKKDARGSLAFFEEAIAEEPKYFEAHYEIGMVYQQLDLPNAAEDAFRRAIEGSDRTYPTAFFALAALLSDQEKYADAETPARKGVALDPADWRGHYQLARALFGVGRVDDSEKSLKEAQQRKPDYPDLYLLSANIHMRRQDYPALLQDFEKYLELAPKGAASDSVREMKASVENKMARGAPPKQDKP